ncbi:annexin A5-like isoform X1 [Marmota flaviventris]|uniref:annexin A5-like isoform X1 n=1 Tax=Marmota flaviventris TaxID=93162 RepID=UPI003A851F1B
MKPSRLYDAYELKHALKGAGTKEKVLTEIIASRTPEELRAIKQVYEEEYGSSLEDDVVGDTSGYYQRMLVVLLQANRDPDAGIDEAQVEQDAQALFQAGELKWGTDEEKFITIFGTRSVSHLRRVFDKYMTISGFQIEETIDRETSGHLEQLLLAVAPTLSTVLHPGLESHNKQDLFPEAPLALRSLREPGSLTEEAATPNDLLRTLSCFLK